MLQSTNPGMRPHPKGPPRQTRKQRRQRRSKNLQRAVVRDIPPELRSYDPLQHPTSKGGGIALIVVLGVAAAALHIAVLAMLFGVSNIFTGPEQVAKDDRIDVTVVDVPPPPEPEPEPLPEIEVEEIKAITKKKPKPKEPETPPPPDPIDVAPEPEAAEPPPPETRKPPRRIVGLSLESTVVGGAGPSFATGNTRMGVTASVAQGPEEVEKLPPPKSTKVNKAATNVPRRGVQIVKAKVKGERLTPEYPATLKAQGIEADVVLFVTIGTDGKVSKAKVVKSSGYPELDEAALKNAYLQEYTPQTRDGVPVLSGQKYTVKFRLEDE